MLSNMFYAFYNLHNNNAVNDVTIVAQYGFSFPLKKQQVVYKSVAAL